MEMQGLMRNSLLNQESCPKGGALDDFVRWEVSQGWGHLFRLDDRIYPIPTSSRGGGGGGGGGWGLLLTPAQSVSSQ